MESESSFAPKIGETVIIPEISYDQRTMEPRVKERVVFQERAGEPSTVGDLLVIRNMGLGDVVMSLVAVRALRKKYPNRRLRFACNREYLEVVERTPCIDEAIAINDLKPKTGEAIVDLRMAVEPQEIRGKIPKEYYYRKNRIDIFLDAVGMTGENQALDLHLKEKDIAWARDFVKRQGLGGRKIVGIQPFCASIYRSWPDGHFKRFLEMIDKERYVVFVLGEKCLWPWADYEVDGSDIFNLLGKTTVAQGCALVGDLDVLVGIDSGLIHVAAALGVRSVCLFGAVDPDLRLRYYPKATAITPEKKLPCSFCGDIGLMSEACGGFEAKHSVGGPCMHEIRPESVIATVDYVTGEEKRCLACGGASSILGAEEGRVLLKCYRCGFLFSDQER